MGIYTLDSFQIKISKNSKPLLDILTAKNIPSDYGGTAPDSDTLAKVIRYSRNFFYLILTAKCAILDTREVPSSLQRHYDFMFTQVKDTCYA